jgi:hypothetical protein
MGYAAYYLMKIVRSSMPDSEMLKAADRASREMRKMFPPKPLKSWRARQQKAAPVVHCFARRRRMLRENEF